MSDLFRVYSAEDLGKDGYPTEWHQTIKHLVRKLGGNRCERCKHPYVVGTNKMEQVWHEGGGYSYESWSPCDDLCEHPGPIRYRFGDEAWCDFGAVAELGWPALRDRLGEHAVVAVEARFRILTVHHLDQDKANCLWWNLVALCQRCHLTIQGHVQLHRVWPWEHSDWFKPYAAGWYAHAYLGEDLDREQTMARLDELLALELMA